MLIVLLALAVGASAGPSYRTKGETKCGYDSCTKSKDGMLNVHIVPHTHDDVGWLKTVDQYYYGSRNDIQKAGVQYILDSVVKELWENPERRFIYVETAFFWKWWNLQPPEVKRRVHELVDGGRLKFVNGAWSMNDEANTYYQTTIDQFTWGLSKLNDTFGECGRPTVGWQIDPFGHSREFASLLAAMGYDGLFLGRIDYQDKQTRLKDRTMEMIWRGDDTLGEASDIFTCVMYNTYSPPPGFCFDVLCQDEPIIDDPGSPDYNVDRRVSQFLNITRHMAEAYSTNNLIVTMGEDFQYQLAGMWFTNLDKLINPLDKKLYKDEVTGVQDFLNYAKQMSSSYRSNNVLVTMGGDFTYMQAGMWYENLDKLILYGNLKAARDGHNINLFYSTPDCYLKAVKEANPRLPIKQDDFFPYASDPHSYWTGYFSSRPTVKYLEAQTNTYLQMVKQLQVLAQLSEDFTPEIDELRSVMGVMQHHDAVTGTEKQHVASDYVRMVAKAVDDAHHVTTAAFNKVMKTAATGVGDLQFDRCQFNESRCHSSEESGDNLIVTVYNPLAWPVSSLIAVPVVEGDYEVQDGKGNQITVQMMDIAEPILDIPYRVSKAKREVYFIADLPPLGYKAFYLTRSPNTRHIPVVNIDKYNIGFVNKYVTSVVDVKSSFRQSDRVRREIQLDIEKYFDDVKHGYPDIRVLKGDNPVWHGNDVTFVPDQPGSEKYRYNVNPDANAKVLLKTKGLKDKNVEEFEKLFQNTQEAPKHSRHIDNPYFNVGGDEMRMLADEPMMVTRYPDEEIADQTYANEASQSGNDVIYKICARNFSGNCSMTLEPYFYPGAIGNNEISKNRSSGAYIFRPDAVTPTKLNRNSLKVIDGSLFSEFRSVYPNNVYTALRVANNSRIHHELDWLVGPIPIEDGVGKEFIIKYDAPMTTNGELYTDSNGRQMLKRKLDKRPQWNLTLEEPVAGNYYPVTSNVRIEDDDNIINILTDRAVGAASLEEGSLELMVHRRLLHDDAFGVGEALNETVGTSGLVAKGTHRLNFDKITQKQVLEMRLHRQVFVSNAEVYFDDFKKITNEYSWLKQPLPKGIHLLTIEQWKDKTLILRLENYSETTKEVDLTSILKGIIIKTVKETLLAANKLSKNTEKWSWVKENEFADDFNKEYGNDYRPRAEKRVKETDNGATVKVGARQIRTFIISYERN